MLNISKEKKDGSMTVFLEGKLDTVTAQDLEASINEDISGLEELIFDMGELVYISSAGLRVLLGAQKIMNEQGSMKVKGANEIIREIFDATGFSSILTISLHKNLALSGRSFHTAPKSARGRILAYLSSVSLKKHSREFDIPFDRQQLADYLNLERTNMSKELSKMRKEGLIDFKKSHFRLIG